MALYQIPQQFWNNLDLNIVNNQNGLGVLYALIVQVPSKGVVNYSVSHEDPPPSIPQKLLMIDGFLAAPGAVLTPENHQVIVDPHGGIIPPQSNAILVASGYLTILPLQEMKVQGGRLEWWSTNWIEESWDQNGQRLIMKYEDTPASAGDVPSTHRRDIVVFATNVAALSADAVNRMGGHAK